ncbi:hypothetical protein NC653_024474 [Populus alba x Populus x berolinensis]|uniref:Uncharacterized protein n=1 Tax=Populus alba x Populus x berolinensis TaxID=444605 RepID=A0AAD6M8Y8_9ROSI|nr:hypothetical protein NC653_024474 [Populus alba x Populus x berolinensis]
MEKSKRKTTSVKCAQVLASPPTTVLGIKSAFALLAGSNISSADLSPHPIVNQASGSGTKIALNGSLEVDHPTNEDLEEDFTPSGSVKTSNPPAPPPPVNVTKANVKGKEKVSTCLNLVDQALVDSPSTAAPTVQVPSIAPSPVDTSEPIVPTHPPTSCATHLSPVDASDPVAPTHPPTSSAAKDGRPCSQVTAVDSEEWHTVGKKRHKSGNKRQSPPPVHSEGNQPAQQNVANNAPSNQQARQHVSKGKAPACSVDIAGTKTFQRPRLGFDGCSQVDQMVSLGFGGADC